MMAASIRRRRKTILGVVLLVALSAGYIVWVDPRLAPRGVEIAIGGSFTLTGTPRQVRETAEAFHVC